MTSVDLSPAWTDWVASIKDRSRTDGVRILKANAAKWQPAGRGHFKCCSPLRRDKNPSFYVYPDGSWFDFGLYEGGDLITFVQKRDGVGFRDALDKLASELGLPAWTAKRHSLGLNGSSDPEALLRLWAGEEERRKVFTMLTDVVGLCHSMLPTKVRDHLRHHYGLSDATIDGEKVGYAPAGLFDVCVEALGHSKDDLLKTGLFFQRGAGDVVCAITQRILFPYWKDGFVEYTIAREFFAGIPISEIALESWDLDRKYKKQLTHGEKFPYVSPFFTHEILWGEDTAKVPDAERSLLLIEGMTDAMMAKQLGFPVISPITTTLSGKQVERAVQIAKRWKEVVILNDHEANQSGTKGAIRTARLLWERGIRVRIGTLPLPDGASKIDVNEFAVAILRKAETLKLSPEEAEHEAARALEEVIGKALVLPEFLVMNLPEDLSLTTMEEKLRELGMVAQPMTALQRADLFAKIAARFPKVPKKDARRVFESAVAHEEGIRRAAKKDAELLDTKDEAAHARAVKPSNKFRGAVREEIGYYERELADGSTERLSTFSLILVRTVRQDEGPSLLTCRVLGLGAEVLLDEWVIPQRAWNTKRSFVGHLPTERMQWTGSDDEVQGVYELLTRGGTAHVPNIKGTEVLGYHEHDSEPRFVLLAGTLDHSGQWMKDPDLVYVPLGGSNLQYRLPRTKADLGAPETLTLAKEVLEELFKVQTPSVILPLVAWFAATPFKSRLARKLGAFPLLNVYGTQGSGKSSLIARLFWPLFAGVDQGDPLSATQTVFALTKDSASTNALPLPYDEYKPVDMGKALEWFRRMLRRIYAGETETRGRADLSVTAYHLAAPTCVAGETKVEDDPALTERFLYVSPNKNWLAKTPEARDAFRSLTKKPIAHVAPLYQAWSLTAAFDAMLERAQAFESAVREEVAIPTIPERVRVNLVTMWFGLEAIGAFAKGVGATLPTFSPQDLVKSVLGEILDVDAQGTFSKNVRDAFDDFLVDASILANIGRIKENKHFAWLGNGQLFLYLRAIEPERSVWRREQGLAMTSPGMKALIRIAREKVESGDTYIIEADNRARMDEGYVRGTSVQPDMVPAQLGVDEFPADKKRVWGGDRKSLLWS